jgi:hypothetical protein
MDKKELSDKFGFWDHTIGGFYFYDNPEKYAQDRKTIRRDATIGYVTRLFLTTAFVVGGVIGTSKITYNMLPESTKAKIQQTIEQNNQAIIEYNIPMR